MEALRDRTIDQVGFGKLEQRRFRKKLIIEICFFAVLAFFLLFCGSSNKYVNIVQSGYLEDYGNVPLGIAFENNFIDPIWSYRQRDDEHVVIFKGKTYYYEKVVNMRIEFKVNEENESFSINRFFLNDEPRNLLDFWSAMAIVYR